MPAGNEQMQQFLYLHCGEFLHEETPLSVQEFNYVHGDRLFGQLSIGVIHYLIIHAYTRCDWRLRRKVICIRAPHS